MTETETIIGKIEELIAHNVEDRYDYTVQRGDTVNGKPTFIIWHTGQWLPKDFWATASWFIDKSWATIIERDIMAEDSMREARSYNRTRKIPDAGSLQGPDEFAKTTGGDEGDPTTFNKLRESIGAEPMESTGKEGE